MTIFFCSRCDAPLTVELSRVALPVTAGQSHGYGLLTTLTEPGTFAVDPFPSAPPWRRDDGAPMPGSRDDGALVRLLPGGPAGRILIAPGDLRGAEFIPDRLAGRCCGLDGSAGPNLACERCGTPVATRVDDCGSWQAVWLDPRTVHGTGDPGRLLDWPDALRDRPGRPPIGPDGYTDPIWEAAAGATLARLLVAADGRPVIPRDGTEVFSTALDTLLTAFPPQPAARLEPLTLAPAGPGLPPADAGLVMVPEHPQTGEPWLPTDTAATPIPLTCDVWIHLAFPRHRRAVPGSGETSPAILRDDPQPPLRGWPVRPDRAVFRRTLARLIDADSSHLQAIHTRTAQWPMIRPF